MWRFIDILCLPLTDPKHAVMSAVNSCRGSLRPRELKTRSHRTDRSADSRPLSTALITTMHTGRCACVHLRAAVSDWLSLEWRELVFALSINHSTWQFVLCIRDCFRSLTLPLARNDRHGKSPDVSTSGRIIILREVGGLTRLLAVPIP